MLELIILMKQINEAKWWIHVYVYVNIYMYMYWDIIILIKIICPLITLTISNLPHMFANFIQFIVCEQMHVHFEVIFPLILLCIMCILYVIMWYTWNKVINSNVHYIRVWGPWFVQSLRNSLNFWIMSFM